MKLQRLLRMGRAEIAFRVNQELAKAVERVIAGAADAGNRPPRLLGHLERGEGVDEACDLYRAGQDDRAAVVLLQAFRQSAARMFAGAVHDAVPEIIAREFPAQRRALIEGADAVRRHRFAILGYGRLDFGSPPDWHFDPVADVRAPRRHWSRIDYLDRSQVGDSKVVWEINRHQWMLELAQAWQYTGDEAYARTFAELVEDWMRHNPPARGINWCSSLEVGMRLISWCWALYLLRRSPALSPMLFARMLAWLRVHARYVERNLSYYFSPNTHLTGEALALVYAGTLFPMLRGARRWRELGRRILLEQLERQVHPDGVHFELSTCYQYYTVEFYLHFLLLEQRAGQPVPQHLRDRLQAMLDFALAMRRPDGLLPQIGDSDGGWLLPLKRRVPGDFRGLFATAAALFQRADYYWAAGGPALESYWLLGPTARDAFAALEPRPPADAHPRLFRQGGFAVLRSGWDENAHQLVLDCGPLGCTISGGHGHADLLSVQISAFGEPYVVDPGTGCYTDDPRWRAYFRSSAAHSTLLLDGRGQAEPAGPFAWTRRPAARLNFWEASRASELIEAAHDAWRDLGVRHRRRVLFVKPRYWLIVDDVEGESSHRVDLRYQFAALPARMEGPWVRVQGRNDGALLLGVFAAMPLDAELSSGAADSGWISPNYGQRLPAPAATWSARGQLPLRLATLVLPLADAYAAPPAVRVLGKGRLSGLWLGERECIRIGENDMYIETIEESA